jgi:hypothetical protein
VTERRYEAIIHWSYLPLSFLLLFFLSTVEKGRVRKICDRKAAARVVNYICWSLPYSAVFYLLIFLLMVEKGGTVE